MNILRSAFFIGFSVFWCQWAHAQCSDHSDKLCQNIPQITCDVEELYNQVCTLDDPSTYNPGNDPNIPDDIPNCTSNGFSFNLQNPQWYKFIAISTTAEIRLRISNCSDSAEPGEDGIQYALLKDCETMEIHECVSESTGAFIPTSFDIEFTNLVRGKTYFFVVDGYAGSICSYEFQEITGFGNFVLEEIDNVLFEGFPNDTVCGGLDTTTIRLDTNPGDNLDVAEFTHWEIYNLPDMANPVLDSVVTGIALEHKFLDPGDYELRVNAFNSCLETNIYSHSFYVEHIDSMVLDTFTFCVEDLADAIPDIPDDPRYEGRPITNLDQNPFRDTIYDGSGCPFIQIVPLNPIMPSLREDIQIIRCNEESFEYEGVVYTHSVFDSIMTLDNRSNSGCDSLINLDLVLLQIEGSLLVSNCEDGISQLTFMPELISPAGQLDSIRYVWTNSNGTVLTDDDGDDNQLEVTTPDSIFLEVAIYKFGESCRLNLSARAEPGSRSFEAQCISELPGSVRLEWSDLSIIDIYLVISGDDTLAILQDTVFTMDGLEPGSSRTFDVVALSSENCPEIESSVSCQIMDCPDASLEITAPDTIICLDDGPDFIDYAYELSGDNGTGMIEWESNGVFDPNTGRFDVAASGPGEFQVMVHYVEGPCMYSDTVCIEIDQMPNPAFQLQDTICQTDSVLIRLEEPLDSEYLIEWDIEGSFTNQRLNDSTFLLHWSNPGLYHVRLSLTNGVCQTTMHETNVEVTKALNVPHIQCAPRDNRIDFHWDPVECSDSYGIYINGVFETNTADTFYRVDGLVLGDSVEIRVEAISGCYCPDVISSLQCFTQACPDPSFDVQDSICQLDTAFLHFTEELQNFYVLDWSIQGSHNLGVVNDSTVWIHWLETGVFDIQLIIDNGSCISEVFSESVEVTPALTSPNISCRSFPDRIEVTWNAVDCSSSFDVIVDEQPVFNTQDTFYTIGNLQEGESVDITVVALSDCLCPNSEEIATCVAKTCLPVTVEIEEISLYCLKGSEADSLELNVNISGDMGTGTGSWSGTSVSESGYFYPAQAGVGVHTIHYQYSEDDCIFSDSISIDVVSNPDIEAVISSPLCPQDTVGNIEIVAMNGTGPYSYFIDGIMISDPSDNPLPPGLYHLEVYDENQCSASIIDAEIQSPAFEGITLSGSGSVEEGEPASYSFTSSVADSAIIQVVWSFNGDGTIEGCEPICGSEIILIPMRTGILCSELTYAENCLIRDCIQVQVTREFNVYYPNIFNPHGLVENSIFWIKSNDPSAVVEDLQIFDRWGNLMYSVSQISMEGDSAGWDGTFNGEYMKPGVYVFKADLRFEDGSTDRISGTFTLVH